MLIIQEKRDRQRPWQRAVPVPGAALSSSRTGQVAKQAGVPDFPNLRDGMTHLCFNILL
jgi:hypothetical protein